MGTETEKLKGAAKEAVGDLVDDDELQTGGEQQQKKARKAEEKAQKAAGHAGAEKQAS